jgi:hypothetical protein
MKITFRNKIQIPLDRVFLVAINVILIYLFVFRYIPSSLDDENYLYHFSSGQYIRDAEFSNSEYLYSLLTRIFSTDDGFLGVRVLIFLGLMLQLFCQLRLHGARSWTYLLGFYLLPDLAIMYSYTQLRFGLGLALACLAFCLDHKKNSFSQMILVILSALFHAGFIILVPIYFFIKYVYTKKKIVTKYFIIDAIGLSILTLLSAYLFISAQEDSRFAMYAVSGLNTFGLIQYILPLSGFVCAQYLFEKKLSFDTFILITLMITILGFNYFGIAPGALARLFNVALMISIISALKSSHPSKYGIYYCIILYVFWIFILSMSSAGLSGFNGWKNII